MDNEFWIVEFRTDGFGNDTVVDSIWRTKEEAEKYMKDNHYEGEIVQGSFGDEIDLIFN